MVFGSRFKCRDSSSAIADGVDDLGTPDRDQAAIVLIINRIFPESLGQISRSLKTESRPRQPPPVSQVRKLPGPLREPVLSDSGWCLICVRSVHSACPSSFCVIPSKGYIETRRVKSGCGCHVASSRTRAQMLIPAADLPPFDLSAATGWGNVRARVQLDQHFALASDPVVDGQRTEYRPSSGFDTAACWVVFFVFFPLRCRLAFQRPTGLACLLARLERQHAGRRDWDGQGLVFCRSQRSVAAESERRLKAVLVLRLTLAPCPPVGAILPVTLQGAPSHRPSPYPRRGPPYDQPRLCPLSLPSL